MCARVGLFSLHERTVVWALLSFFPYCPHRSIVGIDIGQQVTGARQAGRSPTSHNIVSCSATRRARPGAGSGRAGGLTCRQAGRKQGKKARCGGAGRPPGASAGCGRAANGQLTADAASALGQRTRRGPTAAAPAATLLRMLRAAARRRTTRWARSRWPPAGLPQVFRRGAAPHTRGGSCHRGAPGARAAPLTSWARSWANACDPEFPTPAAAPPASGGGLLPRGAELRNGCAGRRLGNAAVVQG